MNKTISSQLLRSRIGEFLDRADLAGEVITITRGDRTKAVLLGYARYLELLNQEERRGPQRKETVSKKPMKP